jgi:hypothetical protein
MNQYKKAAIFVSALVFVVLFIVVQFNSAFNNNANEQEQVSTVAPTQSQSQSQSVSNQNNNAYVVVAESSIPQPTLTSADLVVQAKEIVLDKANNQIMYRLLFAYNQQTISYLTTYNIYNSIEMQQMCKVELLQYTVNTQQIYAIKSISAYTKS